MPILELMVAPPPQIQSIAINCTRQAKDRKVTHYPTTNPIRRTVPPRCLTLLTAQEAADYAAVSTQTVRRWIRAGDLPILRAGRQIRIDESDLLAYLQREADVGTTLSSGAVFPMSPEMQQAVADAMAATGGAEAVPAGWRVFRRVADSSGRHAVAAMGTGRPSDELAGHSNPRPAEAAVRSTGRLEGVR